MTPDRGDILHLQFDPSTGREMKGDHYCLVISKRIFNQAFSLAWVCPISTGEATGPRNAGFLVSLMGAGTGVSGNVHAHQLKALDWGARKARRVESLPRHILDEVLDRVRRVVE
jgi:mRNA interferase ChpB